jgi:hypothetical protein
MPTIAPLDLGEHSLFAGFVDETPMFATVDGNIHMIDGADCYGEVQKG